MSKAFVRESDQPDDDDEDITLSPLPPGGKNYMTPGGYARLASEYRWLLDKERPEVTATVSWAAGNGDRSENGDYIYGKKRLREIDRRLRFLSRRLDSAEVVDPAAPRDNHRIFFGATVCFANQAGEEKTVSIVGMDEIDPFKGYISWISPVARAFLSAQKGDTVTLRTPGGVEELDILSVSYHTIPIEPFVPPSSPEGKQRNSQG